MIRSVRLDASADTPQQVKEILDACLVRLGMGIGNVVDEVYERDGYGYKGRVKVIYDVPMVSSESQAWDKETDAISEMVSRRLVAREEMREQVVGTSGNPGTWSVGSG